MPWQKGVLKKKNNLENLQHRMLRLWLRWDWERCGAWHKIMGFAQGRSWRGTEAVGTHRPGRCRWWRPPGAGQGLGHLSTWDKWKHQIPLPGTGIHEENPRAAAWIGFTPGAYWVAVSCVLALPQDLRVSVDYWAEGEQKWSAQSETVQLTAVCKK